MPSGMPHHYPICNPSIQANLFHPAACPGHPYWGTLLAAPLAPFHHSIVKNPMSQEEEVLGKAYDSRLMARLLKYLRPYRWQVAIALVSILLKSFADVLGPYLTKVAIDRYLAPKEAPTGASSGIWSWLSPNAITGIAQIAAIYVGLLVLSFLLEFLQTYYMQWTGQKVMFDLRRQIFRHLQRLHVAFFDKNPVGRLVTRVTTDVDALNEMFTSGVVSIFEDIFVLVGIFAVMLCMNWKLALITFAVLPFIVVATKIFRDWVRDSYRRIRVAIARINSYLQEHVSGMVVLQLFNRERKAYTRFEEINRSHMDAYKDAIMAYSLYYPAIDILSSIAIACVIWFGGGGVLRNISVTSVAVNFNRKTLVAFSLVRGAAELGVLVAFIQYALRFFRPIMDFSEKYNILQSAMAASERIFKLLDTPVQVVSPAVTRRPEGPGRIEFDHVWFAYRDSEPVKERVGKEDHVGTAALGRPAEQSSAGSSPATSDAASGDTIPDWVLRDVTFAIEPGETVAIVGHTGAGKTTLTSLLLRFYDVQKGAIRIDGVDVKEMDLADLRSRFGVVLQDPFLFSGTIGGNIRLGTKRIQDKDVEQAAKDVNLTDFIRTLPKGFDEEVRERGSTLSTGQKQLISFARALAHEPKILILDEATSSVDTETEFRVRDALNRMVEGRTSLIIAHRLSTVQRADKIIVMHKGQVREMGTHQQLLAQRGIYFKLYQLQYKDQELSVGNVERAPSPANAGGFTEPEVTASADD
jgi:ATP-binding cassette subfamily B multidrug efflux pump